MIKPLYIFDIDGTLALIDHRLHLLDEKQNIDGWRDFYRECNKDKPNVSIIGLLDALKADGAEIILFSGRSDDVREKTIKWLVKNTSLTYEEVDKPGMLTMRETGDYTPDHELKEMWLDRMIESDINRIAAVFDDRQRVVDMWRRKGLVCLQVAPGDF